MWGERQDFETDTSQRKGENAVSRQNGHLSTTVFLKRLSSILELYCSEELSIYRIIV